VKRPSSETIGADVRRRRSRGTSARQMGGRHIARWAERIAAGPSRKTADRSAQWMPAGLRISGSAHAPQRTGAQSARERSHAERTSTTTRGRAYLSAHI